tara:strand:- start:5063 stop:5737 length:675 start_codon:yes stop_codon:yes gene_type:complete
MRVQALAYRRTDTVSARLADNRRGILNAARELVAQGGFGAAQMTDVARRAGVATGTLYRYFPSKEELCRQVFREVSAREMNVLAGIAAEDRPALDRLRDVLTTFASRAVSGRRLAYALLAEPVDDGLTEERTRFRRVHGEIFAGLLDDAVAEGTIPPLNTKIAAACISGAIPTALIGPLAPQSHELEDGGPDVVENIVQFCLAAIRGAGAAQKNRAKAEPRISA